MAGILLLARRYVAYHKLKTAVVVACVTLTLYLPVAMHLLVSEFESSLSARAQATPLVIGAKGSQLDLTLHAMHFQAKPPELTSMGELEQVRDGGRAMAIPLHVKYEAQGYPVVGTSLEYFDFRKLRISSGSQLARLGDCVLGARVARRQNLVPGDRLQTDPENLFDIAGSYPLKMRVVGVLQENHTADDEAVFVDVKTAWIIQGVGHGHQSLSNDTQDDVILDRSDDQIVANAALPQFMEITDDNVDSFHFHGDPTDFPLTAVIAVPHDEKSDTILQGSYLSSDTTQIVKPTDVVKQLMGMVFRIERLFDALVVLLAIVTLLLLTLVSWLSLRLRRREMETMFRLGCSRFTIFWMQAAETAIVLAISALLALLLSAVTLLAAPDLVQTWLV